MAEESHLRHALVARGKPKAVYFFVSPFKICLLRPKGGIHRGLAHNAGYGETFSLNPDPALEKKLIFVPWMDFEYVAFTRIVLDVINEFKRVVVRRNDRQLLVFGLHCFQLRGKQRVENAITQSPRAL